MKQFNESIYEYNVWADDMLLSVILQHRDLISEKIISLFSHILNAQIFWYNRILKKKITIKVWDTYRITEMKGLMEDNLKHIRFIMNNYEPDELVEYVNTSGATYENSVQDILYHVFNHGNYHRGQINMELRSLGIEPPAIDYIFYKRN